MLYVNALLTYIPRVAEMQKRKLCVHRGGKSVTHLEEVLFCRTKFYLLCPFVSWILELSGMTPTFMYFCNMQPNWRVCEWRVLAFQGFKLTSFKLFLQTLWAGLEITDLPSPCYCKILLQYWQRALTSHIVAGVGSWNILIHKETFAHNADLL